MTEKVLNLQADYEKQGHVVELASSVLSLDLKALKEINPVRNKDQLSSLRYSLCV